MTIGPDDLKRLADECGGKITDVQLFPDGHGTCCMSMPLPKDHWLTAEGYNDPPAPMLCGCDSTITFTGTRYEFEAMLESAARYACRASTMNGKEIDFDPDAMVRNFCVGMCGYYTKTGKSDL